MNVNLNQLTEAFSTLNLKGPGNAGIENVPYALQLATSLQTLHDKGIAHQNICLDAIVEAEDNTLCFSQVESSNDSAVQEKLTLPDNIHALGRLFYTETFGNPLTESPSTSASSKAKSLIATPQSPKTTLKLLTLWMLHPDPAERPTIQTVVEKLQGIVPNNLPQFERSQPEKLFPLDFDPHNPSVFAETALAILRECNSADTYCYLSRANTKNSHYKLLGSVSKSVVILLPKKPDKAEIGTFKLGRNSAYLIEKVEDTWHAKPCYALTSLKLREGRENDQKEIFKHSYQKEMWVYSLLEGSPLLPKHYASFTYAKKPHKRLSLYEPIPYCLHEEPDFLFTTKQAYKLTQLVLELHKKGIAHRDLKSENVLKKRDGTFVFCDPDSFVLDDEWRSVTEHIGTNDTIAPERYTDYVGSWFKDDVYALGCIFYEKFFNSPLPWVDFPDLHEQKWRLEKRSEQARKKIASQEFTKVNLKTERDQVKELTYWMLHPDPSKRPCMQNVTDILQKIIGE